MKFFKKCFCLLTAGCLAVPFAEAFLISAEAAETVSISPLSTYEINDGVFEGWGTSLCWWANRVGAYFRA